MFRDSCVGVEYRIRRQTIGSSVLAWFKDILPYRPVCTPVACVNTTYAVVGNIERGIPHASCAHRAHVVPNMVYCNRISSETTHIGVLRPLPVFGSLRGCKLLTAQPCTICSRHRTLSARSGCIEHIFVDRPKGTSALHEREIL